RRLNAGDKAGEHHFTLKPGVFYREAAKRRDRSLISALAKLVTCRSFSEQQPQSQLDLTGLVIGRKGWCPEGRDCSAVPGEGICERLGRQVRIVQNIEHFCPELHFPLLASKILVLEYREIQVTKHRHMEQIPPQISQHAGRREGEARGLDEVANVTGGDFRRRTAGKVPQIVRPLPSLGCSYDGIPSERSIRGDLHVVSAAGLPGVDSAHLPSA